VSISSTSERQHITEVGVYRKPLDSPCCSLQCPWLWKNT